MKMQIFIFLARSIRYVIVCVCVSSLAFTKYDPIADNEIIFDYPWHSKNLNGYFSTELFMEKK